MAHELGHYVLHKEKIDQLLSIADCENSETQGMTPQEEAEANNFAAQILMPEDKVREVFAETLANQSNDKEKALEEMYKIFQVSKRPMEIRLSSLGLLSSN
jgi:Zn-dependent peptidase ImmA (M78 family)